MGSQKCNSRNCFLSCTSHKRAYSLMYTLNVAKNKNLLTEKPGITEDIGKKDSHQQTELGIE